VAVISINGLIRRLKTNEGGIIWDTLDYLSKKSKT